MQSELGITRDGLKEIKNRMAQAAPTHFSPRELLRQYSDIIDGIVRKTFQRAQSSVSAPSVCLVAVGGYGRSELAPYSDVDLLLLYSSPQKPDLPPLIEKALYPLWDLGLDVSCSSRSVSECLKMAQPDPYVKTGLIDSRYLDGEYEIFRTLYQLFSKKILHHNVREFANTLMKDVALRHQKYEDPAYVLEPDIKEGKGGLRDFQIGRWVIRAKYKTDRWDSILFPDQSRILDRSLQFLWALRNELHLLSGRRQDQLTFELQEKIAPILRFSPETKGIEEMMRQYHLSSQQVWNFASDMLERVLYEPSPVRKASSTLKRKKLDPLFGMSYGEIYLLDPVTLKRDPSQLMTLFKHCQTFQGKMSFQTEEAVLESLPFIDDRFRTSESVNQLFLSILKKGERVESILKMMHELGFLSRYIPEFAEIEGRVHYDLYHVHPVDIHSILTVEELIKLKSGTYQKELPLLTSLTREIEKPEILFLTALLHDIGKGIEGDHSKLGEELTVQIGDRMGLPDQDKRLMAFLVRRHLFMLEIAFRRDLHEEGTILRFANELESSEHLKMLYLLTFADIKAVGPEAWTPWKNSLLMELFLKTFHFFERGEGTVPLPKKEEVIQHLLKSLPPEIVSDYEEHLPPQYLSSYSWEEIAHHIELAHRLEKESLLVEWTSEENARARVTVCTKDRYGLFSKITGSMFLNRLNILEAQIHTWGNGVALDTFKVEDSTLDIERRLRQFRIDLASVLEGTAFLRNLLSKRQEPSVIQRKIIPRVPSDIRVNNQDSQFFTIVEISGQDRLGILYEITQALTDHGCDIHFARISTLGNRIVDVFYIQDEWGEKIEEKERMGRLRQTLLNRVIPGDLSS
ncbi:MAG TPA: [protein-PII] uridylyltransferase [Thermodesulfobacteriota bacterium]|nr:[protein-PII] uridylyltransferase [Thermodesulfobacteriota bacterium]